VTSFAITGIGSLVTNDPGLGRGPLGVVDDATVVVEGDRVLEVLTGPPPEGVDDVVELAGGALIPGFVDSHAHPVFAGDRWREFEARMTGEPYTAGGIRTTVEATRAATDEVLRANLARLAGELVCSGVTTFEAKSGYGLTVADEERSLRLARERTPETTFLGAHVVPAEYADRPDHYVSP